MQVAIKIKNYQFFDIEKITPIYLSTINYNRYLHTHLSKKGTPITLQVMEIYPNK